MNQGRRFAVYPAAEWRHNVPNVDFVYKVLSLPVATNLQAKKKNGFLLFTLPVG